MCVNVSPAEEHAALTKTALEYANMATRIRVALKPKPQAMPMGGSYADGLLANQAALALMRSEHELAEAQTRVEELSAMNGVLHRRLTELGRLKEAQMARARAPLACSVHVFSVFMLSFLFLLHPPLSHPASPAHRLAYGCRP
jgi:hypothetical protein